ncbi:Cysteine protease atg4 [Pseudocyphellaria aurata]|nr:Cysteine protease atg4 [Pseudocyphellaria aurata]
MSHVDFGRYKRIVQYFWDPEPKNNDGSKSPIWCLGKEYDSQPRPTEAHILPARESNQDNTTICNGDGSYQASKKTKLASPKSEQGGSSQVHATGDDGDRGWPKDFLDDFESRLWFTYRSSFSAIEKSSNPKASNSVGLAVRLRSQIVDHEWRRGSKQDEERRILRLFADDARAPFSIHRFVQHGASACGKHPGEWFGPSATARCIQALSSEYTSSGLNVYITGDGADVYEDEFLRVAISESGIFTPTLILVGIRLGIDRVTPAYWEALRSSLQLSQSIGIAGGRPSSSHYFVAVQGDNFFYLDPHQTRVALPLHEDIANYTGEEIDSCHTRRLRRLSVEEMDPSMLIGFLITDDADWKRWRKEVGDVQGKNVVHVADAGPLQSNERGERQSAVDDVETFDDEDESDGELVERPPS